MRLYICLGNIESDSTEKHIWSRDVTLRNELDLFVHVLHCKMCRAVKSRHKDVDLILIRQNTEGEYAMLEHEVYILAFFKSYKIN